MQQLPRLYFFYYHPLYCMVFYDIVGRVSIVSTATCYGLDGPEIETWWERGFLDPSRLVLMATQLPKQ